MIRNEVVHLTPGQAGWLALHFETAIYDFVHLRPLGDYGLLEVRTQRADRIDETVVLNHKGEPLEV